MATADQLSHAVGCLSTVMPRYLAKELSGIVDRIASSIKAVVDPLAKVGEISVQTITDALDDAASGTTWTALANGVVASGALQVTRGVQDALDNIAQEYASPSSKAQRILNMRGKISAAGMLIMSFYNEVPFVAAQRACEFVSGLAELKKKNLQCLEHQIRQLNNIILVLIEQPTLIQTTFKVDLQSASAALAQATIELGKSRRTVAGNSVFDGKAFDRAYDQMVVVDGILTPAIGTSTILGEGNVLTTTTLDPSYITKENGMLALLSAPVLVRQIEATVSAIQTQTDVINQYIGGIVSVLEAYQRSAVATRTADLRLRTVVELLSRVKALKESIDFGIQYGGSAASTERIVEWAAETKVIIGVMDSAKYVYEPGSAETPESAAALRASYDKLVADLQAINSEFTVAGIEDVTQLVSKAIGLTKYARRIISQIEYGRVPQDDLRNFQVLAAQTTTAQITRIQVSVNICDSIKAAVDDFASPSVEISFRPRFDSLVDAMRQTGADRAADLLSSGKFDDFMNAELDELSYIGVAVKCLGETIDSVDDSRSRRQLESIRSRMISAQSSQLLGAADIVDLGRLRGLGSLTKQLSSVQTETTVIKNILEQVKAQAKAIGVNLAEAEQALEAMATDSGHMLVGAGGRLSERLEEYSETPGQGVPLC